MEKLKIESSVISEASYDGVDLEVGFVNGRRYSYKGVPQSVFDGLKSAESKGKYFNESVRNSYDFVRKI